MSTPRNDIIDLVSENDQSNSPEISSPEIVIIAPPQSCQPGPSSAVEFFSASALPLNLVGMRIRPTVSHQSGIPLNRRLPMESLTASQLAPSPTLENTLRDKFRLDSFRPTQREVIEAVLSGRDCIVKFGGGEGKSLCYQFISAHLKDTFTIVVSPLVALIRTQATEINNTMDGAFAIDLSAQSTISEVNKAMNGDYPLVFITPEKLIPHLDRVDKSKLRLVAIDEAHCICKWGCDFRPKVHPPVLHHEACRRDVVSGHEQTPNLYGIE